jgi:lipoprotein NlpI
MRVRLPLHALLWLSLPTIVLADSATPLFDYSRTVPFVSLPFNSGLQAQLQQVSRDIQTHPPPAQDCAHTLGAVRFGQRYEDLGSIQSGLGNLDAAIEAFNKALECNPRAVSIHAGLANALMDMGRNAQARSVAARGALIEPDDATLDGVLAQLDFMEEQWPEATERLRTLAQQTEDDERAGYWQVLLWLAQRRAGIAQPQLPVRTHTDAWSWQIVDALRGDLSEAELTEVVKQEADEHHRREMLCEGLFYMGEARLADHQTETARLYFAATVSLKVLYFIEHSLASAELAKLRATAAKASLDE